MTKKSLTSGPRPARTFPADTQPDSAPAPRWVLLADATVHSGVPMQTLRKWVAIGLLPGYRIGPRLMQIDLNDLDAMRIPYVATQAMSERVVER